ncbi:DUF2336 domain-containing protein [Labrys wisconsinensis]|uniref:Uncharacterized protein (DUF2336 family) n=1 Tax=Labrys wisconsinensis TaxID=425677 RepID=A0ABU0JEQ7_9HYPH|nr:DUF2336 domain-containing protein [Labrys wisconsinensis]MDQ0472758.1 uncharacterized protein (DUF2336 family) [Labrys wisconsinensis]
MFVRHFLQWIESAPAGERAEATSALARAFLYSPLDPADRAAAEAAMTVLLDDPSPLVREALAIALAASRQAPPAIIHALAHDQGDIAAIVLAQSPLLSEPELVDVIGGGDWRAQCAVACRFAVPATLSGAIAEVGGADACVALLQNPGAVLTPGVLMRIVERHGADADVRNELLAREDLPIGVRQAVVAALSASLSSFVSGSGWLGADRNQRVTTEAREKATVIIAGRAGPDEMRGLVRHLRRTGQLTAALVLRALLSGNVVLFEEALAELSGLPVGRVSGLVHSSRLGGFEAVYRRAGLPPAALPAFRAALEALAEQGFVDSLAGDARLSRRMTERVLTSIGALPQEEVGPLLLMLRRFAAEAARDEARAVAEDLARDVLLAA